MYHIISLLLVSRYNVVNGFFVQHWRFACEGCLNLLTVLKGPENAADHARRIAMRWTWGSNIHSGLTTLNLLFVSALKSIQVSAVQHIRALWTSLGLQNKTKTKPKLGWAYPTCWKGKSILQTWCWVLAQQEASRKAPCTFGALSSPARTRQGVKGVFRHPRKLMDGWIHHFSRLSGLTWWVPAVGKIVFENFDLGSNEAAKDGKMAEHTTSCNFMAILPSIGAICSSYLERAACIKHKNIVSWFQAVEIWSLSRKLTRHMQTFQAMSPFDEQFSRLSACASSWAKGWKARHLAKISSSAFETRTRTLSWTCSDQVDYAHEYVAPHSRLDSLSRGSYP